MGLNCKVSTPLQNVYLFEFEDTELMAKTFCRIQEFYENPVFKGRYFTLDEYRTHHVGFFGEWDYYTRWGGFNIPGNVVKLFKSMFSDLTEEEKGVISVIENLYGDNFYIIASEVGDRETINHELHHALFYLDECYRDESTKIIMSNFPAKIEEWLTENCYGKDVMVDEAIAYLMFERQILTKDGDLTEEDLEPYIDTASALRLNFFKTKAKNEHRMYGLEKKDERSLED